MNKEVKKNILSIVITVLVVIISVLSFDLVIKNNNRFNNINENINVDINTKKNITKLIINDENILMENYEITVEPEEFYHFKMILESNKDITYEIYKENKLLVNETNILSGSNTIYEGEFNNTKETYNVILKIHNYDESDYENTLTFVY